MRAGAVKVGLQVGVYICGDVNPCPVRSDETALGKPGRCGERTALLASIRIARSSARGGGLSQALDNAYVK
jgi:hypothetical protein